MYFPYLRGKQFELIALRETSDIIQETGIIYPIIEPVKKSTATLRITLTEYCDNNLPFCLILNPQVGEFQHDADELIEFINNELSGNCIYTIGIIVDQQSDFGLLADQLEQLNVEKELCLIHKGRIGNTSHLQTFIQDNNIKYNIANDSNIFRRYRGFIEAENRIILTDPYNKQDKNADYADQPDEFFSDEHLYYSGDGYVGFSDYVTIGEDYTDSGFAPYAVAIHMTYLNSESQFYIRHFVSESNDDYEDVAGTFNEALERLVYHIRNASEIGWDTRACKEFENLFDAGHYPGLGSVKKLSIVHHFELITKVLNQH